MARGRSAGMRTVGLAETVAYAWTMVRSRGEGPLDRETGRCRHSAAAAEIACALNQLDALTEVFRQLRLPRNGW